MGGLGGATGTGWAAVQALHCSGARRWLPAAAPTRQPTCWHAPVLSTATNPTAPGGAQRRCFPASGRHSRGAGGRIRCRVRARAATGAQQRWRTLALGARVACLVAPAPRRRCGAPGLDGRRVCAGGGPSSDAPRAAGVSVRLRDRCRRRAARVARMDVGGPAGGHGLRIRTHPPPGEGLARNCFAAGAWGACVARHQA